MSLETLIKGGTFMSHNPNYTKYSNFSKPQEAPVVEPEVKVEETSVVTEEPVATPDPEVVVPVQETEEDNDDIIGVVDGCSKLNVRKEANAEAAVLATLSKGAKVKVDIDESTDDFYKVCTEAGVEGYCMKKYINID
jgi:hypothetical protein